MRDCDWIDGGKLLELAERKEARAMRKWNSQSICPRGINRVQRLRSEAAALCARAHTTGADNA